MPKVVLSTRNSARAANKVVVSKTVVFGGRRYVAVVVQPGQQNHSGGVCMSYPHVLWPMLLSLPRSWSLKSAGPAEAREK